MAFPRPERSFPCVLADSVPTWRLRLGPGASSSRPCVGRGRRLGVVLTGACNTVGCSLSLPPLKCLCIPTAVTQVCECPSLSLSVLAPVPPVTAHCGRGRGLQTKRCKSWHSVLLFQDFAVAALGPLHVQAYLGFSVNKHCVSSDGFLHRSPWSCHFPLSFRYTG